MTLLISCTFSSIGGFCRFVVDNSIGYVAVNVLNLFAMEHCSRNSYKSREHIIPRCDDLSATRTFDKPSFTE